MPESHHVKAGSDPASGLLLLAKQVQRLKRLLRQGWLDRGVPPADTESVADHSLGVALLAWMAALEAQAAGADLDPGRVLALALVHDLPEAEIGDWTPYTAAEVSAHDAAGPAIAQRSSTRGRTGAPSAPQPNAPPSKRRSTGSWLRCPPLPGPCWRASGTNWPRERQPRRDS